MTADELRSSAETPEPASRPAAFFTATPAEAARTSRIATIVAAVALLIAVPCAVAGLAVAQVAGDVALSAVAVALTAEVVKFGHRVPPTSMFEDSEPPKDSDRA